MKDSRKYLIVRRNDKILSLLFEGNRLKLAQAEDKTGSLVGNIYIGKVKNIIHNIQSAFVEIAPGNLCFLPLKEVKGKLLLDDEICIQISKDGIKTKQPIVTTNLSISGKYCVVTSTRPGLAFSAKLSQKCKTRIKEAFDQASIDVQNYGIVIRTNAQELNDMAILRLEIITLLGQLQKIQDGAPHRTCYSLLYSSCPRYLSQLRDGQKQAFEEIITDDAVIYDQILAFKKENPSFFIPSIRFYEDDFLQLSKLYSIETRLAEALGKKVWLKSGGYLIIEPTEALTVIDVNTGKLMGKKTAEETFFVLNMEAAEEIAWQLVLRNISGIIIVDFINMKSDININLLLDKMRLLLQQDFIKASVSGMTPLGLMELTRMKINRPLQEQLMTNDME